MKRLFRESSLRSLLWRLEESEREDIAFGRDCHVLPAVHLKRHWRRIQRVAGVEVPQVFASARIQGDQIAVIIAGKDDPSGRRYRSRANPTQALSFSAFVTNSNTSAGGTRINTS
jgi:hypothetical protein